MVGAADAKAITADKMLADLVDQVDLADRVDRVAVDRVAVDRVAVDKVAVDKVVADKVDLAAADREDLAEVEAETMALGAEGVVEATVEEEAADLLVAEWAPEVVAQAELRQQPQK